MSFDVQDNIIDTELKQENPLDNPIIYLPIYLDMMTKSDKKIFSYLWWANKKHKEIFCSEKYISKKCNISTKTVQRFFRKYENVLINIKNRIHKSHIISIPKVVQYYINQNGGMKIINNFSYHKNRLINIGCKDPNSNDLMKGYKQSVNKTYPKMSTPHRQKCPPNINNVFNYIPNDNVLYEKSNLENEEILLKFGLDEKQIIKINNNFGINFVKQAINDSFWYSKIGKKIYNPYGFIMSRAKSYTLTKFKGL